MKIKVLYPISQINTGNLAPRESELFTILQNYASFRVSSITFCNYLIALISFWIVTPPSIRSQNSSKGFQIHTVSQI